MFYNGDDPYAEADDLVLEYNRRKDNPSLFGSGGFSSISSSDPEYIQQVIDEIESRGYKVRKSTTHPDLITIAKNRNPRT